jgi:hypothetical protein
MPDEHDQVFARDVFNASLTLMSILVVVITFLAVEYKDARATTRQSAAQFITPLLALLRHPFMPEPLL